MGQLDFFEPFNESIQWFHNDLTDPDLCTVEYAQTRQVVKTVPALGKNAWSWTKDLKDGYYKVSINKKDIHKLALYWWKIHIFKDCLYCHHHRLFTEFMHSQLRQSRMIDKIYIINWLIINSSTERILKRSWHHK